MNCYSLHTVDFTGCTRLDLNKIHAQAFNNYDDLVDLILTNTPAGNDNTDEQIKGRFAPHTTKVYTWTITL